MMQLSPSKRPRLTKANTIRHLRGFYMADESLSFRQYCKDNALGRANLAKIWKASGLDSMKKYNKPLEMAMQTLELHLEVKKKI